MANAKALGKEREQSDSLQGWSRGKWQASRPGRSLGLISSECHVDGHGEGRDICCGAVGELKP